VNFLIILFQNMISIKRPGKTIFEKCLHEGCEKMVKRTASMRKLGRGKYCSREHGQVNNTTWRRY
jgi:hypothetical protein